MVILSVRASRDKIFFGWKKRSRQKNIKKSEKTLECKD